MKIVQVINAMISNGSKITNVRKSGNEYFFLYDNNYKWSITKDETDEYYLHFYPLDDMSVDELSRNTDWVGYSDFVTYRTEELKTKEATESFSELYQLVASKIYGLDDIFDKIINAD
ncbi:hypothetical protein [Dyadobacter sp. CY323]|uniref:hypothetical protein n=1 Tax=Dyadobacter sp. CY323 TaxID=2907302 RepID=UPI001F176557|nr:hypothetical protein [Dyadobacter sp. CY323]MCE6990787.1 hypothetical protein [Dyadobacter sp. CY323]